MLAAWDEGQPHTSRGTISEKPRHNAQEQGCTVGDSGRYVSRTVLTLDHSWASDGSRARLSCFPRNKGTLVTEENGGVGRCPQNPDVMTYEACSPLKRGACYKLKHTEPNMQGVAPNGHSGTMASQQRQKVDLTVKNRAKVLPSRRIGRLSRKQLAAFQRGDGDLLGINILQGHLVDVKSLVNVPSSKENNVCVLCGRIPAPSIYSVIQTRRGKVQSRVLPLKQASPFKIMLPMKRCVPVSPHHGDVIDFRMSKSVMRNIGKPRPLKEALLGLNRPEVNLMDSFRISKPSDHKGTWVNERSSSKPAAKELFRNELRDLEALLCFPVEVAMRLSKTEQDLFKKVHPWSYVCEATSAFTEDAHEQDLPNLNLLIQRFYEVSSWVTTLLITQPNHIKRKATLINLTRLTQCCWDTGNFNSAVEVLAGLKSEKLKPFWLSMADEDLTQYYRLCSAALRTDDCPEYHRALARMDNVPGCSIVPFFGIFLRELQVILADSPCILTVGERCIQSVSDFRGQNNFMSRIGPRGLENTHKLSKIHAILSQIASYQTPPSNRSVMDTHAMLSDIHSLKRSGLTRANSTAPISQDAGPGVQVIPHSVVDPNQSDMLYLRSGCTAIFCSDEPRTKMICWLKLEADNATLSWTKSEGVLPKGYPSVHQNISSVLCKRYSSDMLSMNEMDAGHLDLRITRSISLDEPSLNFSQFPSIKSSLSKFQQARESLHSIRFLVGSTPSDFKQFEFILSPLVITVWYRCLQKLVSYSQYLRLSQVDKRLQWLQGQYLKLYFARDNQCRPPTPSEAIKVFGGRDWTTSSVNIGSLMAQSSRKNRLKIKASTVSSSREHRRRPSLFAARAQFSLHDSDETFSDCTKSPLSSKESPGFPTGTTKSDITHPPLKKMKSQEMLIPKADPLTPDDKRRHSMWSQFQQDTKPITHTTTLDFDDFIKLFHSFYTLLRKDIKDLFDMLAVDDPKQYHALPTIQDSDFKDNTGFLAGYDSGVTDAQKDKVFASLSIASIVDNRVDTGKQKLLGLKEFKYFLKEYQGEKLSREQAMRLILKHERDPALRKLCQMSYEGFCRYLLDESNYAFTPEMISQEHSDMDHPLCHYYIKSSHNTYLTGHQLKGESSVPMYTQVLLTGCRCVELDCWDGDDGYPIIYHGHTLTTKIPFRDVVEAINKDAFTASPYPLVLSLENHCSVSQQRKMARILIDTLGDQLVTDFMFDDDFSENPSLPSPEQLKYMILIKNKKLRSDHNAGKGHSKQAPTVYSQVDDFIPDELEDEEDDDDEIEEYDFEDSDGKTTGSLKSHLDSDSSSSSKRLSVPSLPLADDNKLTHTARPKISPRLSHSRAKSMDLSLSASVDSLDIEVSRTIRKYYDAGSAESLITTTGEDSSSELDDNPTPESPTMYHRPLVSRVSEPIRPVLQRQKIVYHQAKRWILNDKEMVCTTPSPPKFESSLFRKLMDHEALEANLVDARRSMLIVDETYHDIPEMEIVNVEDVLVSEVATVVHTETNLDSTTGTRNGKGGANNGRDISTIVTRCQPIAISPSRDSNEYEPGIKDRTRKNSIKFRPRSAPTYADWQSDLNGSSTTSTPRRKKKVNIAPELSDIVIYTQAVKFKGLMSGLNTTLKQKKAAIKRVTNQSGALTPDSAEVQPSMEFFFAQSARKTTVPSCYQMSSLNENKAKQECRKHPAHVLKHTETHLMRMYPAATRIDSANFSPILYWACGIQMSALNYQTEDVPIHVNTAMFEQSGLSGYVLKPSVMWDPAEPLYDRYNPLDKDSQSCQSVTLKLRVISGQYVCPKNLQGTPQVEVDIISIPSDCAKHKTRSVVRNAVNPIWNEKHSFRVTFQELTFVRFAVTDTSSGSLTGQRIIPLKQMKLGYRHVRLRTAKNQPLEMSTLFIFSKIEEDLSMHRNLSFFSLSTDAEEVAEDTEDSSSASPVSQKDQFLVCVYNVSNDQAYSILKAPKLSTSQDIISLALHKARRKESPLKYVMSEEREVHTISDGKSRHKMTYTRVLEDNENVHEIQSAWENIAAKFVLKLRNPTRQGGQKIKASPKKFGLSKLSISDKEKKKKEEECCHPYLSLPIDSVSTGSDASLSAETNNNLSGKDINRFYTSKSQVKLNSKLFQRGKHK